MRNTNEVIKKIQKLLLVASRSDKPGEVETAQQIAQRLITKYQIQEAELHGIGLESDIKVTRVETTDPYSIDKATLLNSIALPNFCKVLRGEDYCLVYGYASDTELCIGLYELLSVHMITEMKRKLEHYKETTTEKLYTKQWIKSFFGGYAIGIGERIKEAKNEVMNEVESNNSSLALVLRDKQHLIEDYWQQIVRGNGPKRKLGSIAGFKAGKESATQADINQNKLS
jgi:hypothetical protein